MSCRCTNFKAVCVFITSWELDSISSIDWNDYFQVGKDGAPKELKIQHPNLTHEQIKELLLIAKRELKGGLTYT